MKNILQMIRNFEELPEYKKINNIRQFSLSVYIFSGNAAELRKLLDVGKDPNHFDDLWNMKNRPELMQYQMIIVRYLHNFVAAAHSLIDHSRRFYEENYQSTGQFSDYEIEVKKRFIENPLAQFVKGLRQYCQHYESPPIGCQLNYDVNSGISNTIFLEKNVLQEFKSWNSVAKLFLNNANDQIDLYSIVISYENLVLDFYNWIQDRLTEIHAVDLQVVKNKREELIRALGPSILQYLTVSIGLYENGIGLPEDIFIGIMDINTHRSILNEYNDPVERAKAMIAQVKQYVNIPNDLETKIIEIHREKYQ